MPSQTDIRAAADRLFDAGKTGMHCAPVRDLIGLDLNAAYAVQALNTQRHKDNGRRVVGRKIGLTSVAVQKQLGVDQPDFGVLFADTEYGDGESISASRLSQPKAEAEIAFILSSPIDNPKATPSEIAASIGYAVPSIEIVGSRIRDWDIRISDTIADNASSGVYVLGSPMRKLEGLDLIGCGMTMYRNGRPVSFGAGEACLGNPLNAVLWLARKCAELGDPLQAGDVILSGALGPMVEMSPGDAFEARIAGLGSVRLFIDEEE